MNNCPSRKNTLKKILSMEMSQKTVVFNLLWFVSQSSGEKDSGERSRYRWMERHTDPSDKWTDGQSDRQINGWKIYYMYN